MKDKKKDASELEAVKKRLHLAETARKQARNMEIDYKVVSTRDLKCLCIRLYCVCHTGYSRFEKGSR